MALVETQIEAAPLTRSGHTRTVADIAFSPDGRRIASAGWDGAVKVHEVATGKLVYTLPGFGDWAEAVAFSPDGTLLASAHRNHGITLWNATNGHKVRDLESPPDLNFECLDFSPDSQLVLGGGRPGSPDAKVRKGRAVLWNVAVPVPRSVIDADPARVWDAKFMPDGRSFATAGDDGEIRLWEAATGRKLRTLATQREQIKSLSFSRDGRWVVSGGWGMLARLWQVPSGKPLRALALSAPGFPSNSIVAALSPDGSSIAAASNGGGLFTAESGREIVTFAGHTGAVTAIAFSPDGTTIATASHDHSFKLWNASTGGLLRTWGPPALWDLRIHSATATTTPPPGYLGDTPRPGQQYLLVNVTLTNLQSRALPIEPPSAHMLVRSRNGDIAGGADIVWPGKAEPAATVRKIMALGGEMHLEFTDLPGFVFRYEVTRLHGRRSAVTVRPARPLPFTFVFQAPSRFALEGAKLELPDEFSRWPMPRG